MDVSHPVRSILGQRENAPEGARATDVNSDRDIRSRIVGVDREIRLADGSARPYVNLDNAATTPALSGVRDGVVEFLDWYGSVHRGSGAKARVATECYERCHEIVADFVGADLEHHAIVFTNGTTDSLNELARLLSADGSPWVITTAMEHHSNLLPWGKHARAETVDVRHEDGTLDLGDLESRLRAGHGEIRLVAVTGASNVTGLVPPVRRIARLAHEHGAEIVVDAAQVMAHRPIAMGAPDDPERIDYLAFSAHKMYAPFGAGVLVGPRATFERADPATVGGGMARIVQSGRITWAPPPERNEAGTPNAIGAVALARAIASIREIGLERIARHERDLRSDLGRRLSTIPGVRVAANASPGDESLVAVVSFEVEGVPHGLVAAALGHEHGIGVRHGCFCAHLYLHRLLAIADGDLASHVERAERGDLGDLPGLVRMSIGMYNTAEEIAYAADALERIVREGPRERYRQERTTGEYVPGNGSQ